MMAGNRKVIYVDGARSPRVAASFGPAVRGFTLVEFLVVVAVVGALAAITTVAANWAIVAGQQAKCASNLRQIGTAISLYANDNDGWLPGTTHEHGVDFKQAWIFALKPYLGNCDEVRICPADPKGKRRLEAGGTSYILNSFVFVPQVGPFGEPLGNSMNNLRRISQPSKTFFAGNISDKQGVSVQSDHTHSERWGGNDLADQRVSGNWDALCADIQPDRFTTRRKADHTGGSANYLFADGHVENIAAAELKRRLLNGENIARPPGL